jgi:hypothetical protein
MNHDMLKPWLHPFRWLQKLPSSIALMAIENVQLA